MRQYIPDVNHIHCVMRHQDIWASQECDHEYVTGQVRALPVRGIAHIERIVIDSVYFSGKSSNDPGPYRLEQGSAVSDRREGW